MIKCSLNLDHADTNPNLHRETYQICSFQKDSKDETTSIREHFPVITFDTIVVESPIVNPV